MGWAARANKRQRDGFTNRERKALLEAAQIQQSTSRPGLLDKLRAAFRRLVWRGAT